MFRNWTLRIFEYRWSSCTHFCPIPRLPFIVSFIRIYFLSSSLFDIFLHSFYLPVKSYFLPSLFYVLPAAVLFTYSIFPFIYFPSLLPISPSSVYSFPVTNENHTPPLFHVSSFHQFLRQYSSSVLRKLKAATDTDLSVECTPSLLSSWLCVSELLDPLKRCTRKFNFKCVDICFWPL